VVGSRNRKSYVIISYGYSGLPPKPTETSKTVLGKELKFFESKKAEWSKKYKHKFSLIKEEELTDVLNTFEHVYNSW